VKARWLALNSDRGFAAKEPIEAANDARKADDADKCMDSKDERRRDRKDEENRTRNRD
jgi:hypothetical protein